MISQRLVFHLCIHHRMYWQFHNLQDQLMEPRNYQMLELLEHHNYWLEHHKLLLELGHYNCSQELLLQIHSNFPLKKMFLHFI